MDNKFELGQTVKITHSGETGTVNGRAEYAEIPVKQYHVRYKSGDGCARDNWYSETELSAG